MNLRYLERGYVGVQEFDEKVANGKRAIKLGEDSLNYVQIFETLGNQINTDLNKNDIKIMFFWGLYILLQIKVKVN